MNENRSTVLVVDDSPENIQILAGILSAEFRTKIATDGEKALKLAQKEPHPDLVLLDVLMPGMNGYEVCSQLKANPATASIPVLFVTATVDQDEVARGKSIGAEGYLLKPLNPQTVIEAVRRTIRSPNGPP